MVERMDFRFVRRESIGEVKVKVNDARAGRGAY